MTQALSRIDSLDFWYEFSVNWLSLGEDRIVSRRSSSFGGSSGPLWRGELRLQRRL